MTGSRYAINTGPNKMAARKGKEDAESGKPEKPDAAWPVHLRTIYKESYRRTKASE